MNNPRIQELTSQIGREDFPVLAKTAQEIATIARLGERASAQDVSDIILHDPFYTVNVLHAIGLRKRGRLSSEITTVEHAVMMYGMKPFFERFGKPRIIEEQFKQHPEALLQLRRALSRAHHAACQARDWAIYRQDIESEEVYIAAAINDLADIVLCLLDHERAAKLTEAMRRDPLGTAPVQRDLIGFDLPSLQAAILASLKLPELFQYLTNAENMEVARVRNVQLAAAVARHAEFGWHGAALEADITAVAELLRIQHEVAVGHIHRTTVLAARAWQWYGAPPAARWLPLLPAEAPVPAQTQSMPQTFASTQELMRWAMQALRTEVGLQRVVFALRKPDGQALQGKFCIGDKEPSPLPQFEIPLTQQHLFSHLMQKPQGVWLNQKNAGNLQSYLNADILRVTGCGDFFAHSVFLGPKPFGMFYGDCRSADGKPLDEAHYQKFKHIVALVNRNLEKLAGKAH